MSVRLSVDPSEMFRENVIFSAPIQDKCFIFVGVSLTDERLFTKDVRTLLIYGLFSKMFYFVLIISAGNPSFGFKMMMK